VLVTGGTKGMGALIVELRSPGQLRGLQRPTARGVHLVRPFVADDALPRVRFRREGRRKIQLEETARP